MRFGGVDRSHLRRPKSLSQLAIAIEVFSNQLELIFPSGRNRIRGCRDSVQVPRSGLSWLWENPAPSTSIELIAYDFDGEDILHFKNGGAALQGGRISIYNREREAVSGRAAETSSVRRRLLRS
jgi:hypothetical protein